MKIKIELDDGYEEVFEVDEENDEIEDLGTTKEMMQARINELEELNRDKSGDVAFYQEANKACQKEINALRDKVNGWEKRCEALEQELRELQDRIGEQNWTIGCYDQENRELREKLAQAEAKRDDYHQLADFHLDENVKLYRRREALENENGELRGKLEKAEAEAKELRDQLAEKTTFCEMLKKNCHEYEILRDKLQEAQKHAVKELECLKERGYLAWKTYFEPCAEPSDIDADLTTRAREIHQIAVDHGWYDPDADGRQRSFPEIAMLCVCELAEAVESYRKGEPPVFFKPVGDDSKRQKPEGYAVEMMDCVIRILDWFGYAENKKLFSETPDEVMDTKCEYNKTRPYRHGGKKL